MNLRRPIFPLRLFGAMVIISIAGCGSLKPLPSDTFYRLNIARPDIGETRPWTEETIRIPKFRANGVYRERAISYTQADNLAVKQYRHYLWIDSPERMLQDELAGYMHAKHASPIVTTTEMSRDGFEIRGKIRQLDHIVGGEREGIRVVLAFELIDQDAEIAIALNREYTESRAIASGDMRAMAGAFSEAVAAIFERFANDAGALIRH